MSEVKPGHPLYGPWLLGTRPRQNLCKRSGGSVKSSMPHAKHAFRRMWFDIRNEVCNQLKQKQSIPLVTKDQPEVNQMEEENDTHEMGSSDLAIPNSMQANHQCPSTSLPVPYIPRIPTQAKPLIKTIT